MNGETQHIPEEIAAALRGLIHRMRRVILLRGICTVAAVWTVALLGGMALDAGLVLFSQWTRWLLALCFYGCVGAAVYRFILKPLSTTFSLAGIARVIEVHHPELQERISSAVELITSRDDPGIRGSDALIAELVKEAQADALLVRPRQEISLKALRRPVIVAAGACVILLALLAAWPRQTVRLALRTSAPFLNLPNVRAADLVVEPGDTVLCTGDRLRVNVGVGAKPVDDIDLLVADADGKESAIRFRRALAPSAQDVRYMVACPPSDRNFRYRVRAGDAMSRYFYVTVVERPAVAAMDVRYSYPAYTGRDVVTATVKPGDLRAVAGTRIRIDARLNKAVASAALLLDGQPAEIGQELKNEADGSQTVSFGLELKPEMHVTWEIKLTDTHGFMSEPADHLLSSVPDSGPLVTVGEPSRKEVRLTPDGRLPLRFSVEDDYGLSALELLVATDQKRLEPRAFAVAQENGRPMSVAAFDSDLRLSDYDLRGVRQMMFQVRAADNLPAELGGPHEGLSESFVVYLDERADPYKMQELTTQTDSIRKGLQTARQVLESSRGELNAVKQPLAVATALTPDTQRRLDALQTSLETAADEARRLSDDMQGGFYDGQDDRLREMLKERLRPAQTALAQLELTEAPEERDAFIAQAGTAVDDSLAEVVGMLENLDAMSRTLRNAIETEDLAERQTDLAAARRRLDELGPVTNTAPGRLLSDAPVLTAEQWQRSQDQLTGQLAGKVRDMPEALRYALERQQQAAGALAAETAGLAAEQSQLTGQVSRLAQAEGAMKELLGLPLALGIATSAGAATQAPPAEVTEAMADLGAGRAGAAVQKLAQRDAALAGRADRDRRELKTADLAARLAAMAAMQKRFELEATKAHEQLLTAPGTNAAEQVKLLLVPQADYAAKLRELQGAAQDASPLARDAMQVYDPIAPLERAKAVAATDPLAGAAALRESAEQAGRLNEALQDAELAGKARHLADRQADLAEKAITAEAERADAVARAEAATTRERQAGEWLSQAEPRVDAQLDKLKQRQEELAAYSAEVETKAHAAITATNQLTATPSAVMRATAAKHDIDHAAELGAATSAAQAESRKLADQLTSAATGTLHEAEARARDLARDDEWNRLMKQAEVAAELAKQASSIAAEQAALSERVRALDAARLQPMQEARETVSESKEESRRQWERAREAQAELAGLVTPQRELEAQAAALLGEVKARDPALAAEQGTQARDAMREVATAAGKGETAAIPAHIADAAEQLSTMADALEEEAVPARDRMAHVAGEMAERQQELSERVAILGDEYRQSEEQAAEAARRAREAQVRMDELRERGVKAPDELAADALGAQQRVADMQESARVAQDSAAQAMQRVALQQQALQAAPAAAPKPGEPPPASVVVPEQLVKAVAEQREAAAARDQVAAADTAARTQAARAAEAMQKASAARDAAAAAEREAQLAMMKAADEAQAAAAAIEGSAPDADAAAKARDEAARAAARQTLAKAAEAQKRADDARAAEQTAVAQARDEAMKARDAHRAAAEAVGKAATAQEEARVAQLAAVKPAGDAAATPAAAGAPTDTATPAAAPAELPPTALPKGVQDTLAAQEEAGKALEEAQQAHASAAVAQEEAAASLQKSAEADRAVAAAGQAEHAAEAQQLAATLDPAAAAAAAQTPPPAAVTPPAVAAASNATGAVTADELAAAQAAAEAKRAETEARKHMQDLADAQKKLAGLGGEQKELASEARELRDQAMEKLGEASAPTDLANPGDVMDRAEVAMQTADPEEARLAAEMAAREAVLMAERLKADPVESLADKIRRFEQAQEEMGVGYGVDKPTDEQVEVASSTPDIAPAAGELPATSQPGDKPAAAPATAPATAGNPVAPANPGEAQGAPGNASATPDEAPIDFAADAASTEAQRAQHSNLVAKAGALYGKQDEATQSIHAEQLERLKENQKALAEQAVELAEKLSALTPATQGGAADGALRSLEATAQLAAGDTAAAGEAAQQAGEQLAALADALQNAAGQPVTAAVGAEPEFTEPAAVEAAPAGQQGRAGEDDAGAAAEGQDMPAPATGEFRKDDEEPGDAEAGLPKAPAESRGKPAVTPFDVLGSSEAATGLGETLAPPLWSAAPQETSADRAGDQVAGVTSPITPDRTPGTSVLEPKDGAPTAAVPTAGSAADQAMPEDRFASLFGDRSDPSSALPPAPAEAGGRAPRLDEPKGTGEDASTASVRADDATPGLLSRPASEEAAEAQGLLGSGATVEPEPDADAPLSAASLASLPEDMQQRAQALMAKVNSGGSSLPAPRPQGGPAGSAKPREDASVAAESRPPRDESAGGSNLPAPRPQGGQAGSARPQEDASGVAELRPPSALPSDGRGAQSPTQAAALGQLADEARDLAARQSQLTQEMQRLTAGDDAALLQTHQEHVASRVDDVAVRAKALGKSVEQLLPNNGGAQAARNQAVQQLGQADQLAEKLNTAIAARPAGTPPPAAEAGQLPQMLATAATSLKGLEQQVSAAVPAVAPAKPATSPAAGSPSARAAKPTGEGSASPAIPLADAYQAATEAAAAGDANAAEQAAQNMTAAARAAFQQARDMGLNPGAGGGGGVVQDTTQYVPDDQLVMFGINRSDWVRLPGELRDEILQASADEGPEEYRPLIQRYFRDVAAKGHWSLFRREEKKP